jgi:hypothetical protein
MTKDSEWVCGVGSRSMPRAKGPEKVAFKVTVTVPTFERLTAKAKGRPVGTYIAEREEQQTLITAKRSAAYERSQVSPNFKKGGK